MFVVGKTTVSAPLRLTLANQASGKPYVFRPFIPGFVTNLYRQAVCQVTERQYSIFTWLTVRSWVCSIQTADYIVAV